jgi:hypothetical protein
MDSEFYARKHRSEICDKKSVRLIKTTFVYLLQHLDLVVLEVEEVKKFVVRFKLGCCAKLRDIT